MRKRISIVLLGLFAMISLGQAPAPEAKLKKAPEAVKPQTLEEVTADAVRYHPDVRAAAAEVELAQAKWLQTKHNVAIKVATAKRAFENLKQQVAGEEKGYQIALLSLKTARESYDKTIPLQVNKLISIAELNQMKLMVSQQEMQVAVLEKAMVKLKGELANAEADYATYTYKNQKIRGEFAVETLDISWFHSVQAVQSPTTKISGSFANQLRESFDKPIKLEAQKKVYLEQVFTVLLKSANVTGMVRVPRWQQLTNIKDPMHIDLPGGEHTLETWLQLSVDEINDAFIPIVPDENSKSPTRYELYVREYGLLLADAKNPPADAITVSEFLKQVRAEKAK